MKKFGLIIICIAMISISGNAQADLQKDIIKTSQGDLSITFIGHASIYFTFNQKTIYVDPSVSSGSDFNGFPKADMIIITHSHGDHLDMKTIDLIATDQTEFVSNEVSYQTLSKGKFLKNNEFIDMSGIHIEAVPAYNLKHMRPSGQAFHPKGEGNGYIITFGDTRIYVAGDTENIPEMANLENIDIAFLPMNIPYTMTPEMVKDAALLFMPKVIYPYHYRGTDPNLLVELLKDHPEIEVKIRKM